MVEKIAHEATRQPELFSTSNLRIALQARLILGDEALNPNKKDLPLATQESFGGISNATYGKLNHASTDERDQYWKQKSSGQEDLQGFDNQYLAWQQNVMDFVNSPKDKNRIQTLSRLSALGVNWQNFTDKEVDKIFNRYFKNQPKTASNVQSFVDDIITSYNGDYQAIKSDLATIKKLANIFGGNSAELVEAAIEAQAKLKTPEKKQELIAQVNESQTVDHSPTTRLNWLNEDEERLLRWLNGDTPLPPEPKPVSALTPELARDNPDLFTKNLLEDIRNTNPRLSKIWKFACQKGVVLPDNLRIDPNTWRSEYYRGNITLGTAPMSKEAKYRILFDDQKFNYQDEVIYRLSHELSHGLLYYVAESMGQKNAFNYLLKTVVDLNNKKGKVLTALASQGYYRQQGAETQGREDMTELINMYILDPNYLKRYFNFLADDKYTDLREKYGLVNIDADVAQALYDQVEQGLKPLFKDMAKPPTKLEPAVKPDIVITEAELNEKEKEIFDPDSWEITHIEREFPVKEFPEQEVKLVGEPGDQLKIVVPPDILKKANIDLRKKSWESGQFNEAGGAFIGEVFKNNKGEHWTEIVDYFPGNELPSQPGSVVLTADFWNETNQEADRLSQQLGRRLYCVGWAHTHPEGWQGILSGTDNNSNRQIFDDPGQFAYVYGAGTDRNVPTDIGDELTLIYSFFSRGGSFGQFDIFKRHVGVYLKK